MLCQKGLDVNAHECIYSQPCSLYLSVLISDTPAYIVIVATYQLLTPWTSVEYVVFYCGTFERTLLEECGQILPRTPPKAVCAIGSKCVLGALTHVTQELSTCDRITQKNPVNARCEERGL